MDAKTLSKVYAVNGDLQAVNVQSALERAGIPVTITPSDRGLDVMVPAAWAAEARELLHAPRRSGEIYFVPSYPVRLNWDGA